jgi:hypothetical protein
MAEMMEQAEGFAEQPAPDMGMINEPEAMPPQEGGEQSVADDIPQEADEGDYILPYETVLMYGLNQLNRYAKEAIKLAMENNVDLTGTNLDPTDDVPIRISNYEYRIPKGLVPFFGGGKKYLDKIRQEGLELRKRLDEEGGEGVAEQQKAEAPVQEEGFAQQAPMEAMPAEAMPAEAMPAPMMQKGGFVLSKDKDAEILEQDKPETAESKRIQAQQPAMVTPDGKKTQQGLSAPMGYANGGEIMNGLGFAMQDVTPANVDSYLQNAKDATNILTGMQKAFVEKQRTDERLA